MRDAIVYSGWTWKTFNVPERIALALTHLGARVLYCGSPVSILRKEDSSLHEVEPGIFAFRPSFASERLNKLSFLHSIQARVVAKQILERAESLKLSNPIFFYPCLGDRISLLSNFRNKFFLAHIQMDYAERSAESHVRTSDITLAIPHSVYHQQRARFGEKVQLIPQVLDLRHFQAADGAPLTGRGWAILEGHELHGPADQKTERDELKNPAAQVDHELCPWKGRSFGQVAAGGGVEGVVAGEAGVEFGVQVVVPAGDGVRGLHGDPFRSQA